MADAEGRPVFLLFLPKIGGGGGWPLSPSPRSATECVSLIIHGSIAFVFNTTFLQSLDRGTTGLKLRPYLLIEDI